MVKVQVHAGGRGKAGGVKLADSLDEVRAFADQWIGKNLVTIQTDENGQPVSKIYVESCTDIAAELYLGAVVDRDNGVIFSLKAGSRSKPLQKRRQRKFCAQLLTPMWAPSRSRADSWPLNWDCRCADSPVHRSVYGFSETV